VLLRASKAALPSKRGDNPRSAPQIEAPGVLTILAPPRSGRFGKGRIHARLLIDVCPTPCMTVAGSGRATLLECLKTAVVGVGVIPYAPGTGACRVGVREEQRDAEEDRGSQFALLLERVPTRLNRTALRVSIVIAFSTANRCALCRKMLLEPSIGST